MDNKDSGISDEFAEMMGSLAAMKAAEKSDTDGYGAVRDDAREARIKEALKADASLSSNERSRFNQIFKIFKTVVFPGPEAERLQAEKVTEKMPVDTAQEKALKEEKKEGGFFSKLLGLLPLLPLIAKLTAFGAALGALALNFDKVKEAMDRFNKFREALPGSTEEGQTSMGAGIGGIPKAYKRSGGLWNWVKGKGRQVGSAIGSVARGGWNWAKGTGQSVGSWVASKAQQTTDWVKSLNAKKALEQIQKAASPKNFAKLVKGIPALGAVLESALAAYDVTTFIDKYASGKIDKDELNRLVGKRIITGIGALGGATLGAALGAFLAGPIGAVVGSVGGDVAGRWILDKMVDAWGEQGAMAIGDFVLKRIGQAQESPEDIQKQIEAFKARNEADASFYREPMQDFVVQNGTITPFSDQDDILGMKRGGAIDKLIDNAVSGNKNKLSDSLLQEEVNINRKIAQISQEQTELLRAIAANTSSQAKSILAVNNSSNNTTKQFKPLNIRDNFITAY